MKTIGKFTKTAIARHCRRRADRPRLDRLRRRGRPSARIIGALIGGVAGAGHRRDGKTDAVRHRRGSPARPWAPRRPRTAHDRR
ncbi:hypothetical protein ACRAWD_01120 [Caulobacter segnis]